ncbi:beta-glucosidase [Fusarium oxysporum f. sp. radicis-lycopersici 26381]|nr:beta-glucosidase [Fusarium oxysporum f. sp. radicis-lycopersici 26381]
MSSSAEIEEILANLTLQEKISLLAGGSPWCTFPILSKGVPVAKLSDGPNGARGKSIYDGPTAACFPAACSIASSFDVDLAKLVATALAEETLTKGARCILSPTVCMQRHPLGGRNFETFSEDPLLTGQMAIASVQGLQSKGVSATVKHLVANEQETDRLTVNTELSQRALREIYLKPFEMVVKSANPWAIMTSYNKINGTHADSHEPLLKGILRGQWNWQGLVMSDWGGINSLADSLNAGVDLEMPGPARWRTNEAVLDAVSRGEVTEAIITERARNVLTFLNRLNCFQDPNWKEPEEKAIDRPEHRALIREAGAKGIVLLKNTNDILPLTKEKVKGRKIAVFGYAKECLAHGGGSASVNPHYRVTPWDALCEAFADADVEFVFAKGAHTFRQLPVLTTEVVGLDGSPGFSLKTFETGASEPMSTSHGFAKSELSLLDGHALEDKVVEIVGFLSLSKPGVYRVSLAGLGPTKLLVNGRIVFHQVEPCLDAMAFLFGGSPVPEFELDLSKDMKYEIRIISAPLQSTDGKDLGFLKGQTGMRLGFMSMTEYDKDLVSEAVELASSSDYSIVFTGNDPMWETEGQDQASFNLPKQGSQDRLVEAVAAACPESTIVVNSTGVAVALPWLDQVAALLQAWFPGQEAGHSICDVLTGAQNSEGHLTCTFMKQLEDCPAYGNFPGDLDDQQKREVNYSEGVFIGYRHFDRLPRDRINFPFGFGLSYTKFDLALSNISQITEEKYLVHVRVSNMGNVEGAIAVQIYAGRKDSNPEDGPIQVLVGFKKVRLEPQECASIDIPMYCRDLAYWDEKTGYWVLDGGEYVVHVSKSAGEPIASFVVSLRQSTYAP